MSDDGTTTGLPDEYRVRVYPSRRWSLFGHSFGRKVHAVEVYYVGDDAPVLVEEQWIDAADEACATAFGVDQAREHHEHAKTCRVCTPDPADGPGPLVVYVGARTVIDERTEAA